MKKVSSVIIGAGHSGIAMSRELVRRGVDHVVLERARVANAWRTERWDGLRLLTPNWMNGLPGHPYLGDDPHGFMSVAELIGDFDRLVAGADLPIRTDAPVDAVRLENGRYQVDTPLGTFTSRSVVVASGACAHASIPSYAGNLPGHVRQFTPISYKRPSDLPKGRVLIVGASASGAQLARDIHLSGRPVVLAVGSHTRVPRRYRGADIMAWMHLLGNLDQTYDQVDNLERVRGLPSLQLTGSAPGGGIDLNALQDLGVEITGRMVGISEDRALFSGGLANACTLADLKMNRLLAAIDAWLDDNGLSDLVDPPKGPPLTRMPAAPRLSMDFKAEGVGSVVWATGFRPDHAFLQVPVFDRRGRIQHEGGVVAPGLYVMGLMYLRRLSSSFIDGAVADARALSAHLHAHLDGHDEIAA